MELRDSVTRALKGRAWHLLNYREAIDCSTGIPILVVSWIFDIVCIPKREIDDFCRILEVFSAWNMFVELTFPRRCSFFPEQLATLEDTQYKSGNVWFPQDPEIL